MEARRGREKEKIMVEEGESENERRGIGKERRMVEEGERVRLKGEG